MKPTLLIAEGDAELREGYRSFLTGRGFAVETAADGLECLEKLRRFTPAAVVLDRDLRWGGGAGVVAWLRDERAMAGVGVVMTAPADHPPGTAEDAQPPGVTVLPKPVALTTLLEGVRAAVAFPELLAR